MARRRVQSPKQGTTRSGRSPARDTDLEDDAATTESQQMLALRPLLKKPKSDNKEVQQFRAKVAVDQQQLKALLEQRVRQAEKEETRRRNEIASKIMEALKTPNRPTQGEMATFAGTKIAGNAVYASVADVLTASEDLITEYRRLDNSIKDLRNERTDSIADTWKQDIDKTEEQLKMGARVALRNVKKTLGANVENEEPETMNEDGGEDMEGVVREEEKELNYELRRSLRYAERGVKRMVKGLPNDEAD